MALPGFRDFYPDDCAARNAIFAKWREVARRYGFVEYDGPPLEPLDLFTRKSGDEIVTQLYHFKDKGDRDVALRPEMTPTLARLVTARHKDFKKPLKWFSIPQVYRYERPQKGRGREHYQLNCDIIGEAGLEADVELIALLIDVLRAFGLTENDFVIRLSDRQFWTDFMNAHHIHEAHRYDFIQAIDKSEREPREKTAEKLNAMYQGPFFEKLTAEGATEVYPSTDLSTTKGRKLSEVVFNILDNPANAASERLDTVETGLRHRGLDKFVKRDFTVVRGLAYYTGVVFEAFDRTGEFRAIAGGGRYDSLLKNLGGVDLPALGFGIGDMVLGEILEKMSFAPEYAPVRFFMVVADENYRRKAMQLIQELRQLGGVTIDYAFQPLKIGKQLQYAEERKFSFAIIVDSKIDADRVDLKDLTTREQRTLAREDIWTEAYRLASKYRSVDRQANGEPNAQAQKAIRPPSPPSS